MEKKYCSGRKKATQKNKIKDKVYNCKQKLQTLYLQVSDKKLASTHYQNILLTITK